MKQHDSNQILEWIRGYMADKGYSPSRREIGQGCNISTISVVNSQLNGLQKAGRLQWTPGVARSIVLLGNGNGHGATGEEALIQWRTEVMGDPPDDPTEYQEIVIGDYHCVVMPMYGRWYGYAEESGQLPTVFGDGYADSEVEAKKLALRLLISRLKKWLESAETAVSALPA
jgi:SOS-response transcriptional repressor LexA